MEFFHGVNVDWLGKKWYFLAFSLIFSVSGIISMAAHWAHPVGGVAALFRSAWTFAGGTKSR